jgi:hypothetical protein
MPKIHTIVRGDVGTVLGLPPSGFVNRSVWTQKKSDMLAHFMQVAGQISRSSWMSASCNFRVQGGKVLKSQFPSIESFVYGAVYFRQLYAGDKLFFKACDIYTKHAGDPLKASWVTATRFCPPHEPLHSPRSPPAVVLTDNSKTMSLVRLAAE